ncbi:heparinase II/III-like protein [Clostridium puniceum]|uniref:Heparinase II/III-like protein n=1 Tax=Clostridium puniceum TaxID=29367 RepID=A0A1S8TX38_9CLOT|nr:heparinase II/III family protein [Clostridium puniceum]OOM82250.1 heparinase II/III-like protein [Clostridium puniceum]
MKEYFHKEIRRNTVRAPLMDQIEAYVKVIIKGNIPQVSYSTYVDFYKSGSRKEFEESYFERRKQLTALGLYLQWNNSKDAIDYFQELLWTISNEFSWCLAAHLQYGEDTFGDNPAKVIDLFSAETAQTLSEIIIIHKNKIDLLLCNHIKKQIKDRVINPFINKNWEWESATHNWSAVCGGCIGITALLMEKEEKQKLILNKVERALECYISGFGDDGVTLEGIGYWSYGFGYYIYYKALKNEIYLQDNKEESSKTEAIANFPQSIQISEKVFLPFSDVPPNITLPSGLLSYLQNKFKIKVPLIEKISPFDFDHCYRWGHVSRNLWWTSGEILNKELENCSIYFQDAKWMVHRKDKLFFAIKGGSNHEPHNHNDVGSFVAAIDGEIILTDLGAGAYTKGYFGSERYTYNHTRSYWHSVPFINNCEQEEGAIESTIVKQDINSNYIEFNLELSQVYPAAKIKNFYRKARFENNKTMLTIEDSIFGKATTKVNEGFISYIKPELIKNGEIIWKGTKGNIIIKYDCNIFDYYIEKEKVTDHYNQVVIIYRLGLITNKENKELITEFKFYYEIR